MKIENPSNRLLGILVQTGSSFAGQNVPRRSNIEKHVIFEAMEDRYIFFLNEDHLTMRWCA